MPKDPKSRFSMNDAVRFGWQEFLSKPWFYIQLSLVFIVLYVVFIVVSFQFEDSIIAMLLATLIFTLAIIFLSIGYAKITLNVYNDKKVSVAQLWGYPQLFLKVIAGGILQMLIVLGGLILFIVPGIIWGLKYSLTIYFIIDKGMGPVEALKASNKATMGAKFELLLFSVVLLIISYMGMFALFVGIFVAIPVTVLAKTQVYKTLDANTKSNKSEVPSEA